MNGYKAGHALALLKLTADGMSRTLGRNHYDVDVFGRNYLTVMNIKAVREHQSFTRRKILFNTVAIKLGLLFVVDKYHYYIRPGGRLLGRSDLKPQILRFFPGLAALIQTYRHVRARVVQIKRVRVSLRTEADNGYLLVFDAFKVAILFVIHYCHDLYTSENLE